MGLVEVAIDKAKDLFKLAQQSDNIQIQQQVLDLQSQMLGIQEEVQRLRKENEELKNTKKVDKELVLRENAYWQDSAPESRRGPFCMHCYDAQKKLITMVIRDGGGQSCSSCGHFFETTQSAEASRRAQQEHDDWADEQRGHWGRNLNV